MSRKMKSKVDFPFLIFVGFMILSMASYPLKAVSISTVWSKDLSITSITNILLAWLSAISILNIYFINCDEA